jgi:hypothetical protein
VNASLSTKIGLVLAVVHTLSVPTKSPKATIHAGCVCVSGPDVDVDVDVDDDDDDDDDDDAGLIDGDLAATSRTDSVSDFDCLGGDI